MSGSQRKTILAMIGCAVLAVVSICYYTATSRPVVIGFVGGVKGRMVELIAKDDNQDEGTAMFCQQIRKTGWQIPLALFNIIEDFQ